ncbi:MobC family plasmid mobilization relaxosome protein [Streptomyces sp. CA2R106]|uniref:MobC family plasmid mobilization relaxosome protein n=1 Tax=Streptomyces sp. CA2R106 TaxID=3120153 RepID=UPI0030088622
MEQPQKKPGIFTRISQTATGRSDGASWSGRNSYRVSSALASAPAGAEENHRQGAPDRMGEAERGLTQDNPPHPVATVCPSCGHPAPTAAQSEPLSGREPNDPPLPAPLYRKRAKETRDRVRSIRFTPTAERVIDAAAHERGQYFAGYVGDAAYAHALGNTATGSPEDDPARPIVENVERLIAQLRRTGNNLNQITHAIHSGTIPDHTERVLDRVEEAVENAFILLDGFVSKDGAA